MTGLPVTGPAGTPPAGTSGAGPLSGYRVVDLTVNMTGPLATMMLADQGADVVKVEAPQGDVIRRLGSGRAGTTAYFANLNRTKRSIVVDVRQPDGRDLVRRLAEGADVFIENFRPGVMERLGLGAEELCASHPALVYVSITGYGRTGPLSATPVYDHVVQAVSGIAARQADRSGVPALVRHGIVDKATGLSVAQAVTAALLARARTGTGSRVEVSMLDVALNFLWPDGMMNHTCLDPVTELPPIANTFRLTETADGFVALITVTDDQWQGLMRASGRADLLEDPQFKTSADRLRNGGKGMRMIATVLAGMPTAEVVARLTEYDVPCAAVTGLDDVRTHPQVIASGSLEETIDPYLGRVVQPRPAPRFGGIPEAPRRPAPGLGEHTDEILGELGLTPDQVLDLRRRGVVGGGAATFDREDPAG